MSYFQPSSIKAIAHSIDIPRLTDDAAKALAPDVEYRLREVLQEAMKFAKHSKRTTLLGEDVQNALRVRNVEPLYGFSSRDPARYVRATGQQDLFYMRDRELPLDQVIECPLPRAPRDVGFTAHWLLVEGRQPQTAENTLLEGPGPVHPAKRARTISTHETGPSGAPGTEMAPAEGSARSGAMRGAGAYFSNASAVAAAAAGARDGAPVAVQAPVAHLLTRELQVYFDRVVGVLELGEGPEPGTSSAELAASTSAAGKAPDDAATNQQQQDNNQQQDNHAMSRAVLASLASDPGLHPLAPYFSAFIAEGVRRHLRDLPRLERLLQLAGSVLANPGIDWEHYLPQMLPALVTCLVNGHMGAHACDDHWHVRDIAAELLASVAKRCDAPYHNVRPRLVRLLGSALADPSRPLPCKYGAIVGLKALGGEAVRAAVLPTLAPFVSDRGMWATCLAGNHGERARHEAACCRGALLEAVGSAMYEACIGRVGAAITGAGSGMVAPIQTPRPVEEPDPARAAALENSWREKVLEGAWRENADLGQVLEVVLHLLGPELLAYLPLPDLPAFSL